jgi:hypothetical protein
MQAVTAIWIFATGVIAGGIATWVFAARAVARRVEEPARHVHFIGDRGAERRDDVAEEFVDHIPEGCIDSGIDVVDPGGRLLGTALIPSPPSN